MVTEEDILKLSGGGMTSIRVTGYVSHSNWSPPGDWHVAYILLYAARRLERLKEQPATDSEQAS